MSILSLSSAAPVSHLADGGFELASPAVWTAYGLGYSVDRTVKRSGAQSIRCESGSVAETHGVLQTFTLNQTVIAPIVVSGWSRAEGVSGSPDGDYSLYVDITYSDGSPLYGQTAAFDTGTHGWQFEKLVITPAKPVRSINLYALFRSHTGRVWFDDLDARDYDASRLFDGQEIAAPVLPRSFRAGWFVRDVAAKSQLVPLSEGRGALNLKWSGLSLQRGGKVMAANLRNLSARNRAVTVYYIERFDASHPIWWNDIRSPWPAQAGHGEYANLTAVNVGASGQLSIYPYACVTGGGKGLALGTTPATGARVARISYNPKLRILYLAYDFALTPAGDSHRHDSTLIEVTRLNVDPSWGFRDAAAQYARLFPEAYARRTRAEGIWLPFTGTDVIQRPQDFGIGFHEGDNSVASDRALGVLSFRYVEPMTYWMAMPTQMPRTYTAALNMVREQASGNATTSDAVTVRRQAQAVLYSGTYSSLGELNVGFRNTPWCDGAVWILNPNPKLPHPAGGWTKARLNAADEPIQGKANEPDGEYLDSLEAQADVLDYGPNSLNASSLPLTFTTSTLRPVLPTWFSVYEATAALSSDLHRHGNLLMANSTPWRFSAFAPLLDVLGTECDMFSATGAWTPESDAIMNLRRTCAYHKPYLLLLNTDFSKVSGDGIALYFKRCLFYGIYPSMFSADAATSPYWQNAALYNRDRPIFKTYIPVIKRLSAAGWEPVTLAHSDNAAIWVERFGTTCFTVLNSGTAPASATLRFDMAKLMPKGRGVGSRIVVRDLLSGSEISKVSVNSASVHVALQPSQSMAIRLND